MPPVEAGQHVPGQIYGVNRLGMRHESPDHEAFGRPVRSEQGKGIAMPRADQCRDLVIGRAPRITFHVAHHLPSFTGHA